MLAWLEIGVLACAYPEGQSIPTGTPPSLGLSSTFEFVRVRQGPELTTSVLVAVATKQQPNARGVTELHRYLVAFPVCVLAGSVEFKLKGLTVDYH